MMKSSEAKIVTSNIDRVVNTLIGVGAYQVTQIISKKVVVRATRRNGKRRIDMRSKQHITVSLKIGAPNVVEQRRIERMIAKGERFDPKSLIIKMPSSFKVDKPRS